MVIITTFDTETSGLPTRPSNYKRYGNPFTETSHYDSSRIIEVGYVMHKYENDNVTLIEQRSMLIKPDSFVITNSDIHGIPQTLASEYGSSILDVLKEFMVIVSRSDVIVSHNVDFDKNITCSEMVRAGMITSAKMFMQKQFECTMKLAMNKYALTRFPTLKKLFESVCENGKEWTQNHRAMDDALKAADCYFAMKKNIT